MLFPPPGDVVNVPPPLGLLVFGGAVGLTGRTGGPDSSAPPAEARVWTARGAAAAVAAATRVEEQEERDWSISSSCFSRNVFFVAVVEEQLSDAFPLFFSDSVVNKK